MEKEFEEYWTRHKDSLFLAAPKALQDEMNNTAKPRTAADWLLYVAPILVTVAFINARIIRHELLNFLAAMVVCILATLLSTLLKPYLTGKRRTSDIDADVKAYFHQIYQKQGLEALEEMRK